MGTTGTSGTLAEPADAREAADLLAAASRDGLAVIPRGGGTKIHWGNPPRRSDIVLSTALMNRIVEHPWADLTVTVESGCTFRSLQDALRVHGQRVAADPLWPDRATVGGVLSTNDTGALRLRFGGWRDLIIGTTIAFADGTIASSGGKVVKNVAGYDLSKLATGAFGTLGVITTAIFRLHPLPQHTRSLTAVAASSAEMQRLIAALQDSKLAHTSLQVRAGASQPTSIDILFEGTTAGIDAQIREARALAGNTRFEDSAPSAWNAREDLWAGAGPIAKVSTLTSGIAGMLDVIARGSSDWTAVFQATGLGSVRIGADASTWRSTLGEMRSAVAIHNGSVVIQRALDGDASDVWGDPGDALPLMRAVKHEFDPGAILNPGRFVGGI
jgi:glycolate oxidase FAD binding subunit